MVSGVFFASAKLSATTDGAPFELLIVSVTVVFAENAAPSLAR